MDSNFEQNPLIKYPALAEQFVKTYGLAILVAVVVLVSAFLVARYGRRRRIERRITGQNDSLTNLATLRLKKGRKASERNPSMPAVTVKKLPPGLLIKQLQSTAGRWTFPGGSTKEPQACILGRSGVGKNETLIDPALYNAIFCRPDPVVVNDAKGAMYEKFGRRVQCPQYVYTFDPFHRSSESINLVQNRRMAEMTAAAVYPIGGEKVKIYNRLARSLFLALVEHVGYRKASLEEVYRLASNRGRLEELAQSDPKIAGIIGGENKTLIGDVISSLLAPLEPLESEEVARVFRSSPDQPALSENIVVWIVIPEGAEEVLGPLAAAIMRNLYERAKAVSNPVRFVVDEAGSCLAFDDLARYLTVGRGRGVYFLLALQDLSQLVAKIGIENARSALGSAGVQFWGASNDPATMRYVSELSGRTRVALAEFEEYGFARAWRQLWSSKGAKFGWRYLDRAAIEPHHVNGLPALNDESPYGYWYRYAGDPTRITLILPTPMFRWIDRVLPATPHPRPVLGFPDHKRIEPPTPPLPALLPAPEGPFRGREKALAAEEAEEDHNDDAGLACPSCGLPVRLTASFSECCGARM